MNPELQKANALYKQSQESEGLSIPLKRGYLERALVIYRNERLKAKPEHQAGLLRNFGVTSLRLAEVLDSKFDLHLIIYHLAEAVTSLTTAWEIRRHECDTQCSEKIEEYVSDCFERAFRAIDGDVESQRIPYFYLLDRIFKAIGPSVFFNAFRMRFYLARGLYYYKCGVKALEVKNFKITTQLLEYCRVEWQSGLQLCGSDVAFLAEFEKFREDIDFLKCSCGSIRFRSHADELFQLHMMESEEPDFDIMWDILDMYKSASLECREKDLENEAIADCRQGRLFEKVFKCDSRAKEYYRQAFNIAQCLQPSYFTNAGWFQECKNALERYQKATLAAEEKLKQDDRSPYLEKLEPELKALDSAYSMGTFELLKHIYTLHPPKHGKTVYDEKAVNSSNVKKVLIKAISQYHPDKQVQFGMEWTVLCDEITKYLSNKYGAMKGTPD